MSTSRPVEVMERLRDERSRRVVLLSHCLLDENTRFAGGAFRPGAVDELIDELQAAGVGIHQLHCPEQRAWGGILRPPMAWAYGAAGTPLFPLRRLLLALLRVRSRHVFRRLAREAARDVADYRRAGIEVTEYVGVATSPSCGVSTTIDMGRACEAMARCPLARLSRARVEDDLIRGCAVPGEGMFAAELRRALERRGLAVGFSEHDLRAEMPTGRDARQLAEDWHP